VISLLSKTLDALDISVKITPVFRELGQKLPIYVKIWAAHTVRNGSSIICHEVDVNDTGSMYR
jgi:hypothetical protein